MVFPTVVSRMIQSNKLIRFKIDGCKITGFGTVANKAGPGKVGLDCLSSMLDSDDVVRLVWQK
jgi:hypothetical protein